MKQPVAVLLVALLALAACAPKAPPPAPAPTTPSPAAASSPPASSPVVPAAVTVPVSESPVSAKPGAAKADAAASSEESALERTAALPASAQLPAGKWVAGTNYRPVVPAQPTDVAPGKVEVIEMFWYACPHCYALDPYLESWRRSKPAYIEFRRVHVTWGEIHRAHARLFYTLQALGKEDALHSSVFSEMHDQKNFMFLPGDERGTLAAELAFVKPQGISEADFMNASSSFGVQTNLQKADDLVHRYRVEGVPLIVINGKYLTDVTMAGSPANVIAIINDLAASERRH